MITLASDCLLFQTPSGESVPYSADMISIEVGGDTPPHFDSEFVDQATKAVFHYFKHDQSRTTVTIGEFADALEKVLHGLAPAPASIEEPKPSRSLETDLRRLAMESGQGCELFFFPLLREELRQHLQKSPRVVRFHGLRGCVKQLAGARRWTGRCRDLHRQIVDYLRECLHAERAKACEISLVVE
jgi:hypothetical protein